MSHIRHFEVLLDADDVARRGAAVIAEHTHAAIAAHGQFTIALSGGRGPWKMFAELDGLRLPWGQIVIFQVDERVAPDGDPDRNLTHMRESLPAQALERIRPMPVQENDLERAADSYARSLPPELDLVHLGLGPDGHTASLVPGDPVLDLLGRDVAITNPYQGRRRMTITYPVLARARALLWVVTGEDKSDALQRLHAQDRSIPAGRVDMHDAWLLADRAAAGESA